MIIFVSLVTLSDTESTVVNYCYLPILTFNGEYMQITIIDDSNMKEEQSHNHIDNMVITITISASHVS